MSSNSDDSSVNSYNSSDEDHELGAHYEIRQGLSKDILNIQGDEDCNGIQMDQLDRSEPIKYLPKHWTRYFVTIIYGTLPELHFFQMTVMVTKGQPVEK
jgi:hypothetical protein